MEGYSSQTSQDPRDSETWDLYTDGASGTEGSGAGLILISPSGHEFTYALRFDFSVSNNEAEYEALLAGIRIAKQMNITSLHAHVDSQLVAHQLNGQFEAKDNSMKQYLDLVKALITDLKSFHITQGPRSQNKRADALSKLASLTFAHLTKEVLVEILKSKSTSTTESSPVEETSDNWMTTILQYILRGDLPADPLEAKRVRMKSPMYQVLGGNLYRKSFTGPLLRCLGPNQAAMVIREVHEGSCGLHAEPRTIVGKILRQGYFWPTMHRDTLEITKKCESCQMHAPVPKVPRHDFIPVTSAWPFYKWGIDIVGPFPTGPGNVKFLIVAIDYFTKWVEAKPLATISGKKVKNFVWEDIVCRFGIPHEIVSDNGKQFEADPFRSWCEELNIKQIFTSVAHPQSNGQVEVTNRDIVTGIKARLGMSRTHWVDELPNVLWAHRTTPKGSTKETPFSLVYGTEAVIPAEISVPSQRVQLIDTINNDEELRSNLDLLEERRNTTTIRLAEDKQRLAHYYNKRVQFLSFKPNDYVWRKNEASRAEDTGKLGPKWEGPYVIRECLGEGTYSLSGIDGKHIPRTWHVTNLKRCYV